MNYVDLILLQSAADDLLLMAPITIFSVLPPSLSNSNPKPKAGSIQTKIKINSKKFYNKFFYSDFLRCTRKGKEGGGARKSVSKSEEEVQRWRGATRVKNKEDEEQAAKTRRRSKEGRRIKRRSKEEWEGARSKGGGKRRNGWVWREEGQWGWGAQKKSLIIRCYLDTFIKPNVLYENTVTGPRPLVTLPVVWCGLVSRRPFIFGHMNMWSVFISRTPSWKCKHF